jgi:hypothetical protein
MPASNLLRFVQTMAGFPFRIAVRTPTAAIVFVHSEISIRGLLEQRAHFI